MQIREDDRALLQRIAVLSNADEPRKQGGEIAARQHRAAWLGELADNLFHIEAEVRADREGRRVASVRRFDDSAFRELLARLHALEQRGFIEFATIDGKSWSNRITGLMDRLAITATHLFQMGFLVRLTPDGWAAVKGLPGDSAEAELTGKDIPPLTLGDGNWVKAKVAAQICGLETATLKDYRSLRHARHIGDDGMSGVDRDGRVWRRQGTPNSHPYYLRSSLQNDSQ